MVKAGGRQIITILLGAVVVGVLAGALAAKWPRLPLFR